MPVHVEEHIWITLSDGCRLGARLWLPEAGSRVKVPAVLEYIPYRKRDGTRARDEPMHGYFAEHGYAAIRVDMGKANLLGPGQAVVGGRVFSGLAVDVGNPHLACVAAELTLEALAALDVAAPVSFAHAQFSDGVNVEVLTAPADGAVSMRVHERGVGETRSCGTGTVAAAVAALSHSGASTGTLTVRVSGGDVVVTVTEATSYLRGPSVLVARGELNEGWWQNAQR